MIKHRTFSIFFMIILLVCLFPVPSAAKSDWNVYLGQLHNHSGYLDKLGEAGYEPADAYAGAKDAGMDFFAVTDFSHSFENAKEGSINADGSSISQTWAAGKEAATLATEKDFIAIYGYEMAWRSDLKLGHIVTLATSGWQSRNQESFQTLQSYYNALTSSSTAIGMFCHPGDDHGDFLYFGNHAWDIDSKMALLEVSGEDGAIYFDAYDTALKAGWHVAPAANGSNHKGNWGASDVRTGILAESLTEESLYEAIRDRRVYATLEPDLEILYSLGGHIMGSQVTGLENYTAEFQLSESETVGTVEIVTEDGVVAACDASETSLTVPAGHDYYYLRLRREGSTVAVTAPVWVEAPTDFGIETFTSDTAVPIQGEELHLSFSVYNHESVSLTLDKLALYADDALIWEDSLTLSGGREKEYTVPYTHEGVGITKFTLTASGTISGGAVSLDRELSLSYRPTVLTAHILVDGRHSDVDYEDLESLVALAETSDMDVGIFRGDFSKDSRVVIVPAPTKAFSENYPQQLKSFVENGGHLILCGSAGNNDQLNSLLSGLGSSMAFHNDTATDPVNNGGNPEELYPDNLNKAFFPEEGAFYCQLSGCTVDAGNGTWLVRGMDTLVGTSDTLLAMESLGKGKLYIAGSFFLKDDHLVLHKNQWDTPRANQRLLEAILENQRSQLPLTDIKTVRSGAVGEIYRVKGYVTAGTSDKHNRFPNMIYLQDSTGGIEITSFAVADIEVGTALDITGQLHMDGKNPALKLIGYERTENDRYRFDPDRLFHRASMNYSRHGGELMKVEGVAEDIRYTSDGLGIQRFTLTDPMGYPAEILIEDYIHSGAYGVNHLAEAFEEGDTVRAFGILHRETDGNAVLRVRNCDEVVEIPPVEYPPEKEKKEKDKTDKKDRNNPKTSDDFFTFSHLWSTIAQKEGF